jgi:phage terminase small subunit
MQQVLPNLSDQQKRFCDEYLVNFNAYRAAISAGYSENTAHKGELLHMPKIQTYLKLAMNRTADRLQITHDMILRELAKVAFSSMGNYYDERGILKPMNELTEHEKAAISQYQALDAVDNDGQRYGELSKIKLHNKMSALDKIARHLNFYGSAGKGVASSGLGVASSERANEQLGVESFEPLADLTTEQPEVLNDEQESFDTELDEVLRTAFNEMPIENKREDSTTLPLEDPDESMRKILTLSPLRDKQKPLAALRI